MVDFEVLGPVSEEMLRQAAPASNRLKTLPAKADTLLPEDHHYQVRQRLRSALMPLLKATARHRLEKSTVCCRRRR